MSAISSGIAGITQAQQLVTQSASNTARDAVGISNGSLASDTVSLSQAKTENDASVKVLNASSEMQKALLDIFA